MVNPVIQLMSWFGPATNPSSDIEKPQCTFPPIVTVPIRPDHPARRGTMGRMTTKPAGTERLRDLARLRRVRDRIDREYAQPLDVEALAQGAHMSAGHL